MGTSKAPRLRPPGRIIAAALPALVLIGAVARAQTIPGVPPKLAEIMRQLGVQPPGDGQPLLFGDWRVAVEPPVKNPDFTELMARARREDVVLPLGNALFDPKVAQVGQWQSEFFLANYGTALFLAKPFAPGRLPVVLVHGINGTPRDFTDLADHLEDGRYQPVFFYYPSGMPLAAAARQLGERLKEFSHRHPATAFAVIGHSMGGVVATGVLDQMDVADSLASWRVLVAISSPFSGIQTAQYAHTLPRHPPAWDDLAGGSAFLQQLQATRFPRDLAFYLFFGARSTRPLLAALGNNDGVLTIDGMVAAPLSRSARDVFGFYEDHTSILSAPLVSRRLDQILKAELGG